MLYGRRLDDALEHVDGSRYALVHAVSKRARFSSVEARRVLLFVDSQIVTPGRARSRRRSGSRSSCTRT